MDEDLKLIFNAIESGKCLPFLGAGACASYTNIDGKLVPGLPTGKQLAQLLAKSCDYPNGADSDLLKISEFFVYTRNGDREELSKTIQETLIIDCPPRPIHTILAQLLPIKVMLTSNYDHLLETEFDKYQRILTRHVYNPLNPRTGHFEGTIFFGERDVILHKMHGSIDQPESLVITRSDYIRYLANLNDIDRGIPEYFRKTIMPQFTLLFLGYSLEDWNFQVIWEGVLANYTVRGVKKISYALMKDPSNLQKRYWMTRNVILLDMDLTEFAIKLAEHFNLEIPQLGIEKKPDGESL